MSIKYLLLDMDGLLVDSEKITYLMWKDLFAAEGFELSLENYCKLIGQTDKTAAEIIARLFPGFDPHKSLYPQWEAGYADIAPKGGVPLKEGALELLDYAEKNGIKKAIASSNNIRWIREILTADGVYDRMDAIVHGQMVQHGKPEPDIFLLACEMLGGTPEECLVLEDSNAGIIAGHAAGMQVVCVPDLKAPSEEAKALCTEICPSLLDVPAFIEKQR